MTVDEVLDRYAPGQPAVWSGRPPQGIVLRRSDALLIPFSLVWAGIATSGFFATVFGSPNRQGSRPPFILLAVPVLFFLVGVYFVIGRFFHDAWNRSRTLYVLTDQRAIIEVGSRARIVPLKGTVVELQSTGREGGIIWFGTPPAQWASNTNWPGLSSRMPPSFELSNGAREVFERILASQQR